MMAMEPPMQMMEMAITSTMIIMRLKVLISKPKTENFFGRSRKYMKNLAASAGMIMFASISARLLSPAANTRNFRL